MFQIQRGDGWRTEGALSERQAEVSLRQFRLFQPRFTWSIVPWEPEHSELSEAEITTVIKRMLAPIGAYDAEGIWDGITHSST